MLIKVYTDDDNIFKILQQIASYSYNIFMLILRLNLSSILQK